MAERRGTGEGGGSPSPIERTQTTGSEEVIELLEERPEVTSRRIEAGRVRVGTRVVTEARSLQVPVFHESVVIERRPLAEPHAARHRIGEQDQLVVAVEREEPAVELRTYVRERVRVGKRRHSEERTVTVDARREELDVDREGLRDQPGSDTGARS